MGAYASAYVNYAPVLEISNPVNVDMTPVADLIKEIKTESAINQNRLSSIAEKLLTTTTAKEIKNPVDESVTLNKYILILSAAGLLISLLKGKKI